MHQQLLFVQDRRFISGQRPSRLAGCAGNRREEIGDPERLRQVAVHARRQAALAVAVMAWAVIAMIGTRSPAAFAVRGSRPSPRSRPSPASGRPSARVEAALRRRHGLAAVVDDRRLVAAARPACRPTTCWLIGVVLGQQDAERATRPSAAAAASAAARRAPGPRRTSRPRATAREMERAAAAELALDPDPPAHQLDQLGARSPGPGRAAEAAASSSRRPARTARRSATACRRRCRCRCRAPRSAACTSLGLDASLDGPRATHDLALAR